MMRAEHGLAHVEASREDLAREQKEALRRILRRMGVANFEVLRRADAIARKAQAR